MAPCTLHRLTACSTTQVSRSGDADSQDHPTIGTTGSVQTLNYDDTTNSQNYAICIRREKGYCANAYVADSASNRFLQFFLSHFLIYFITVLVLMAPTQKEEVEPSAEMTL